MPEPRELLDQYAASEHDIVLESGVLTMPESITGPARTVDEMRCSMTQHYGVWVSCIGEEGDMVALGHHEPKRTLAALNRYSREECGLDSITDERWPTYRAVLGHLEWRHARLVHHCDGVNDDPEHDNDTCGRCREIRDSAWWLDYSNPATPDSFPITLWRA